MDKLKNRVNPWGQDRSMKTIQVSVWDDEGQQGGGGGREARLVSAVTDSLFYNL